MNIHVDPKTINAIAAAGATELARKCGGAATVVLVASGQGNLAVRIENAPPLVALLMLQTAALELAKGIEAQNRAKPAPKVEVHQ